MDGDMGKVEQRAQIKKGDGFVAALDQSGGSTPKALGLYGIGADAYSSDDEMFDLIHGMRARIIKSPAFNGDRIVGAILFEMTMDREIDGTPTAEYLWNTKGVVPFLKVDKGLEDAVNDAKLMKPIDGLDATLDRALAKGIYGTKMRSVIDAANPAGIAANVAQQFEIGKSILAKGLMPILEPEVTISIPDKPEAEAILRAEILKQLDALPEGAEVMLKLSLPSSANHYKDVIDHPKVLKVVALSGGYSRDEANALLAQNAGMIASFSRALTEGLNADQSEDDFNALLDSTIASIKAASVAG
jgi:fructose-bisphosphate aldolase class I